MTDAKHHIPTVSVGMPVYNGERHIRQALDSLLAQDFEDFELIISDNASTDGTQEICLEYATRDSRIRYYRNYVNMGMTWNFNRVFELATGEFFMWAAHDDYRDHRYIRLCLEAFGIAENIVLSGSRYEFIAHETEEAIYTNYGFSTIGLSAVEKLKFIACLSNNIAGIFYGIYKKSALRKLMPLKQVFAGDILLLAELSLYGDFITIPEVLMFERSGGSSANMVRYMAEIKGTSLCRGDPHFDHLLNIQEIIFRTDKLSLIEKIRLALYTIGDYCHLIALRIVGWIYRRLLVIWPSAALRIRELWYKVAIERKRSVNRGIKNRRQGDKSSSGGPDTFGSYT